MDNMTIDNYDAPSCVPRIIETYPPQASAIKSMRKSTSDSNKLEDSTVIASLNHVDHVDHVDHADYANHVDYATGVSSTSVHSDFDALDNHSVQKNIGSLNYSPKPFPKNVVIGSSANDGVGLSTTLALLASHISSKKYVVALIDADISNGGLDVLLGLEQDEGRRLQEVQAPLGRLDGYVLRCELLHWNNVDILAYAPWKSEEPKPWVIEAAIRGLSNACDVVIVDIGSGFSARRLLKNLPTLAQVPTIFAAELSVLGLARLRAYWRSLESDHKDYSRKQTSIVAGLNPRGLSKRFCPVKVNEACDYLLCDVEGPIGHDPKMYEDIISGYGIRDIPKSAKIPIEEITTWLLGDSSNSSLKISGKQSEQQYKQSNSQSYESERFSKISRGKHGFRRY
ncbi:hypothetical protein AXE75_04585 [Gardnerella vaginalis]|uniref:hypothetical protein n=1 Tax=Gardnerella vaginalis TaxID=2702 RepID=UPI000E30F673|nr:hypothetical protein [Gardnerella vaginalis]RFD76569.1 hypothetical protein AXE75_04585 [Gardnerella vaginalis]